MKPRKRKDFEIKFYEKLMAERPNFIHVLYCLGDAYTQKGFYKEGLEIDRKLAVLRPDEPIVHYNLACSQALTEDVEGAFKSLKRAVLLGYSDFSYIFKDPDLKSLREDPRFEGFSRKIKQKNMI
jgi:tetratricopeptide (TPR) repeat protein